MRVWGERSIHKDTWQRLPDQMALLGLYVFAISIFLATAANNVAVGIILLATLFRLPSMWKDAAPLSVFWFASILTAYVFIQSLFLIAEYPILQESRNPNWRHAVDVAGLLSVVMAWWLVKHWNHLRWLVALAGASLVVGLLVAGDYATLMENPFANRRMWGQNPIKVGYMAATGFSAAVSLIVLATVSRTPKEKWYRLPAVGAGAIVAVFLFIVTVASQTRGAWLAIAAFLVLLTLFCAGAALRRHGVWRGLTVTLVILVTAAVGVWKLGGSQVFESRIAGEGQALQAILDLDREALYEANRSMGIRVNMWVASIETWQERPWFGFGTGSKPLVYERTELDIIDDAGHLHNTYVEILLSLGIIGTALVLVTYGLVLVTFYGAWRRGRVPDWLFFMVGSVWLTTFFALLTDVRIGGSDTRAFIVFILALTATGAFRAVKLSGFSATGSSRQP